MEPREPLELPPSPRPATFFEHHPRLDLALTLLSLVVLALLLAYGGVALLEAVKR